jgi:hypothetical protein
MNLEVFKFKPRSNKAQANLTKAKIAQNLILFDVFECPFVKIVRNEF